MKKGFTLIELLVVISIIGILSSVVLTSLSSARAKAKDSRTAQELHQIDLAIQDYYLSNGVYPSCTNGESTCCIGLTTCYDYINDVDISSSQVDFDTVTAFDFNKKVRTFLSNLASSLGSGLVFSEDRNYVYYDDALLPYITFSWAQNGNTGFKTLDVDKLYQAIEATGQTGSTGGTCSNSSYITQPTCVADHSYCSNSGFNDESACIDIANGSCSDSQYTNQGDCTSYGSYQNVGCSNPSYTDEPSCTNIANGSCSNSSYGDQSSCTSNGSCSNSNYTDQSSCTSNGSCSNSNFSDQYSCTSYGVTTPGSCSGGGHTDEGSCTSNGVTTPGSCSGGGYTDAGSCVDAGYCDDGYSTNSTDCGMNGYAWNSSGYTWTPEVFTPYTWTPEVFTPYTWSSYAWNANTWTANTWSNGEYTPNTWNINTWYSIPAGTESWTPTP